MANRKTTPTSQLDMFGALKITSADQHPPAPLVPTPVGVQAAAQKPPQEVAATPTPANDRRGPRSGPTPAPTEKPLQPTSAVLPGEVAPSQPRTSRQPAVPATSRWVDDEWWTLAMVCAYLKLGRKAVWERKRDPKLGFPQPVCLGSSRPRWRGNDVRTWADAQG